MFDALQIESGFDLRICALIPWDLNLYLLPIGVSLKPSMYKIHNE